MTLSSELQRLTIHTPTHTEMLRNSGKWATLLPSPPKLPSLPTTHEQPRTPTRTKSTLGAQRKCQSRPHNTSVPCAARRRSVRHGGGGEEEDEEDRGDGEEHGHNKEIVMLELYSQSARGEALVVHAAVDGEEVEVLIYKGFSSSLSYGTSPDPSTSILPAKAQIKSIDRIKGPFDPSNIEYIEKGLTWENFKQVLTPKRK
ncbi:uncharacterized protein LOC115740047 [Rhodamnia argentea]|uniref:Uncharacterized protein LOC115740047 n=1 Tax=Rhodamnia argentea TaxID=178133 RepID=A0A8B8P3B9_9MYRT|nr:uncharacterized protein LOC115740047 [Rhodamnia argentea]